MSRTNFAAITRVKLLDAAAIFHGNRDVADIARDCAVEALRVLHDGLGNPDDKLRLRSAEVILSAHCRLAAVKQEASSAFDEQPQDVQVEQLRRALQAPQPQLAEALRQAGYEQQVTNEVASSTTSVV